jgi:hypothetical protein
VAPSSPATVDGREARRLTMLDDADPDPGHIEARMRWFR